MNPFRILLFISLVFLLLLGVMMIYPQEGIKIGQHVKLIFPAPAEFFTPDTTVNTVATQIVKQINASDSVAELPPDTSHLARQRDSLRREQLRLHFPPGKPDILDNFFSALSEAAGSNTQVRVMHYGDSQIEGDRITGPLRDRLQDRFGAAGPGLFPVVPVAPKLYVNITYEGDWKRYPGFGITDSTVKHKNYGALINFTRYAPVHPDTLLPDTATYHAAVLVNPTNYSYSGTRKYSELHMHWGNTRHPVRVTVIADGVTLPEVVLPPGVSYRNELFDIPDNAKSIRIEFSGKDSPDIYALSLKGNHGVLVDNIPFRGGSGTEFARVSRSHLRSMLTELNPSLFILEFGGNVLPYVDSKEECVRYGNWFGSQITMLKKLVPGASVIVIGPADMSVKEKTLYVTHPFLEDVRDALRNAAFNSGAAFWDMYGAMGGKNSMPVWVEADPPLAASDYIHFTPKGANHMAGLFSKALLDEYEKWKQRGGGS